MNEHRGPRAVVWETLQAGLLAPSQRAQPGALRAWIRDHVIELGPAIVRCIGCLALPWDVGEARGRYLRDASLSSTACASSIF
jgi:hypothetical protein